MPSLTLLANGSATGNEFTWPGGAGVFMVAGAFVRGQVKLQFQAPDAATWVDLGERTNMSAPGAGRFDLPAGVKIRAFVDRLPVGGAKPTAITVIAGTLTDAAGAAGPDRELAVVTYLAKTASTGVSVGDTVTLTQVLDLSGNTPTTVATIWRNQTTAQDLAAAPPAASLTISGQGALTNAEIRASALPVSGPATDAQLRASALPVSGPLTDAQLRNSAVPVSGPATNAELRASALPVAGPLTDAQLRNSAVPVSGPATDAQLRATALPVSGPATDAQLRASALPVSVSGVATAAKQDTGNTSLGTIATNLPAKGLAASSGSTPVVPASDANIARETYSSAPIQNPTTPAAGGTGFTSLNGIACVAVQLFNPSSVDIEFQLDGAGGTMVVPAFQGYLVQGVTNANQIGVRRRDQTAASVALCAQAFVA